MKCADCRWWKYDRDLTPLFIGFKKPDKGYCHYAPPTPNKPRPTTEENDYCGEFSEKEKVQ